MRFGVLFLSAHFYKLMFSRCKSDHRVIRSLFLTVICCLSLVIFVSLFPEQYFPPLYQRRYNDTPLSLPKRENGWIEVNVAVVSDLDEASRFLWQSFLRKGVLRVAENLSNASIQWSKDPDVVLTSKISGGGRAMELSDLIVFNGDLLTIDDRTGIVYKIVGNKTVPFVIINDGDGTRTPHPKKIEWMTKKGEHLFIGGLGKELTTNRGVFINDDPFWVAKVDIDGRVEYLDWSRAYKKMRSSLGLPEHGYLMHEAVQWCPLKRTWTFLPRRVSFWKYHDVEDEMRGANVMIVADEDLENFVALAVDDGEPTGYLGFSAFQFVPETSNTVIVALRSEETNGVPQGTYLTVFDTTGHVILPNQKLEGSYKFEGIAFI